MRKFLAFILLLSHMNTSMFFPQVPEQDVFDRKGNQLDNITSIVEWVRVKTGLDHTADNENDNRAQNLHQVKDFQYTFDPTAFTKNIACYYQLLNIHYAEYRYSKIPSVTYDILIPPPKA
ncbi:MAG TPA: hypothetical protein VLI68_01260 [Hanamia sp.]|jgi:hypothetical protein|nr:hypothetical protein [Hanamia sp.]